MPSQKNCVRFLLPWRGREPGDVNRELDPGLMASLVENRRAEWCECEDEAAPAKPKRRKR